MPVVSSKANPENQGHQGQKASVTFDGGDKMSQNSFVEWRPAASTTSEGTSSGGQAQNEALNITYNIVDNDGNVDNVFSFLDEAAVSDTFETMELPVVPMEAAPTSAYIGNDVQPQPQQPRIWQEPFATIDFSTVTVGTTSKY